MSKIDLTKPNRQSPKGLVLIFLIGAQKMIRALWPALLVYFLQNDKFAQYQSYTLPVLLILFVLLVVHAILYFLNFKFHVDQEKFILRKGYLRKQELNIPFERIQAVNYKANVLQRFFNVVSLEIDTAGSKKKELKIIALEHNFADELKNVLSRKEQVNQEEGTTHEAVQKKEQSESLLKLNLGELIKIGLLENHLKMALIIIALGWRFYQELADIFKEEAANLTGQVNEQILQSSLILLVVMGFLFIMISVVASVVKVLIRHFDYKLFKTEASFQMQAGLLSKKNMIVPFRKIQELSWGTNPLKKAFSLFSVKIKQAQSQEDKKKAQLEVPGCERGNLNLLQEIIFGENEFVKDKQFKSSRKYFWRVLFFMGFVPVLVSLPLYIFGVVHFAVAIAWFAFSILGSFLAIKKRYFQLSENQIIVSQGMFGQDWKQLSLYKIQVVDFRQSIFQKSSGLASIRIYTASGNTSIPFINENLARELHKYLVYKIQSTEQNWM